MQRFVLFAIVSLMSLYAVGQPTLTPPTAVTDPTKIESKNRPEMQTFSIEKLYMTRAIGGTTWSPDDGRRN